MVGSKRGHCQEPRKRSERARYPFIWRRWPSGAAHIVDCLSGCRLFWKRNASLLSSTLKRALVRKGDFSASRFHLISTSFSLSLSLPLPHFDLDPPQTPTIYFSPTRRVPRTPRLLSTAFPIPPNTSHIPFSSLVSRSLAADCVIPFSASPPPPPPPHRLDCGWNGTHGWQPALSDVRMFS